MGLSEPSRAATTSAAIKANIRLAADLWRSLAGAKCFWRAGPSAWRRICRQTSYAACSSGLLASPWPAHDNCRASQNSPQTISSPRSRPETPRSPCQRRCIFALSSPRHGRTRVRNWDRPELCNLRFASLRKPLEAVLGSVQEWLQFNSTGVAAHPKQTRVELLRVTNHGLDASMHAVALQAVERGRTHPHGPPPSGSGDHAAHPEFVRPKTLLEEGSVKQPRRVLSPRGERIIGKNSRSYRWW